jgi:hypothetical protein
MQFQQGLLPKRIIHRRTIYELLMPERNSVRIPQIAAGFFITKVKKDLERGVRKE